MMERRRFVKGLAATPFALMLAQMGCKQDKQAVPAPDNASEQAVKKTAGRSKTLNVYIHGMFAIMLDEQQKSVFLKAPDVGDHAYQATTFTLDPADSNNLIPGNWTYTCPSSGALKDSVAFNCNNTKIPAGIKIGQQGYVAIDIGGLKPGDDPHWMVTLPMPDRINGLRASRFNYFSSKTGLSQSQAYLRNEMFPDQFMPLVYVLSYQIAETAIYLNNDNALPINFGTADGVARLHFHAERPSPPLPGPKCDPNIAIKKFNRLFKQNLDLSFYDICDPKFGVDADSNPHPCSSDPSIIRCDERTLVEMTKSCDKFSAGPYLEDQFKDVIQFETQLTADANQKSLAPTPRHTLPLDQYRKLVKLTPGANSKPPHNCTSMLCLQKGK